MSNQEKKQNILNTIIGGLNTVLGRLSPLGGLIVGVFTIGGIIGGVILNNQSVEATRQQSYIEATLQRQYDLDTAATTVALAILPTSEPASNNNTASPTNTPSTSTIQEGTILIDEDFNDMQMQGIDVISGKWDYPTSDTGKVYVAADNSNQLPHSVFTLSFGNVDWHSYVFEYEVRFIELGLIEPSLAVYFRADDLTENGYIQTFTALEGGDQFQFNIRENAGRWKTIKWLPTSIQKNKWYSVRIVANGDDFRIYVDDIVQIEASDNQLQQGKFRLDVGHGTHAQFDNIRVTALGEN
jgi:hypothetical protein